MSLPSDLPTRRETRAVRSREDMPMNKASRCVALLVMVMNLAYSPCVFAQTGLDLNGYWRDGQSMIVVTHSGSSVEAHYIDDKGRWTDGPGGCEAPDKSLDFRGMLTGNQITGKLYACDPDGKGVRQEDIKLTVSADGLRMTGSWFSSKFGRWNADITITRGPSALPEPRGPTSTETDGLGAN